MMSGNVTITAYGMLKNHLPEGTVVHAGQTAGQAVEGLQLDLTEAVVLVINGRVVDWNHILEPGDQLQLVLAIGGGFI